MKLDPLIEQARLVNLNAEIERNLAARKQLRNEPHKRGWMTRHGLTKCREVMG